MLVTRQHQYRTSCLRKPCGKPNPKPKRHHYVPESTLWRFTTGCHVFVYRMPEEKIYGTNPTNAAAIGEFHTLIENVQKDVSFGEWTGRIESNAATAIEKLSERKNLNWEERY